MRKVEIFGLCVLMGLMLGQAHPSSDAARRQRESLLRALFTGAASYYLVERPQRRGTDLPFCVVDSATHTFPNTQEHPSFDSLSFDNGYVRVATEVGPRDLPDTRMTFTIRSLSGTRSRCGVSPNTRMVYQMEISDMTGRTRLNVHSNGDNDLYREPDFIELPTALAPRTVQRPRRATQAAD